MLRIFILFYFSIASAFAIPTDEQIKDAMKPNGFQPAEVDEIRRNCDKHQYAMNVCSLYDSFKAKLTMEETAYNLAKNTPATCRAEIVEKTNIFESQVDAKCLALINEGGESGTMGAMVANTCREKEYERQTKRLMKAKICAPCSRCFPPNFTFKRDALKRAP